MPSDPLPAFSLIAPPYRTYLALSRDDSLPGRPGVLWGAGLIWNMDRGRADADLRFATERPAGLPLVVVLPPAEDLRRLKARVLEIVEDTRPHSILPQHPKPNPEELAHLLRREPEVLAGEILDFLVWRGLELDQETRRIVRRMVELSADVSTLSAVARGVYLSRRALGRRFKDRGLPVPSHWLQFFRVLRAVIRMQNSDESLFDVARAMRYPDGFTLSNQMERLLAVRPSFARERLGWEWVVEAWLLRECALGGLGQPLRGMSVPAGGEGPEGHAAVPERPDGAGEGRDSGRPEGQSGAKRNGAAA
jgi:AraC-like DNA-binding protein